MSKELQISPIIAVNKNKIIQVESTDILSASYGDSIDNDSHWLIPKNSMQPLCSTLTSTEETETDKITVQSTGSGIAEIQILEY